MRRAHHHRARGFTLVELAVVVVIVGVLAVVAIVVFTRYRTRARLTEATDLTAQMRKGQEAHKAETGLYMNVSSSISSFYPSTAPGKHTTMWGAPCAVCTEPHAWSRIHMNQQAPVMFGYASVAGLASGFDLGSPTLPGQGPEIPAPPTGLPPATPVYTTIAWGDTDLDGNPAIVVSYSVISQIFVQTE